MSHTYNVAVYVNIIHVYNVAVCVVCHTRIMLLSVWYVTHV